MMFKINWVIKIEQNYYQGLGEHVILMFYTTHCLIGLLKNGITCRYVITDHNLKFLTINPIRMTQLMAISLPNVEWYTL